MTETPAKPNTAPSGLPRLRGVTARDYLVANRQIFHSEAEYRQDLVERVKKIVKDDNPRVVQYFLLSHTVEDVLDQKKVPDTMAHEIYGAVTLYELLSAQIKKNRDYARKKGMD